MFKIICDGSKSTVPSHDSNGVVSPKFGVDKYFHFKRATVILLGTPPLKAQNDKIC